MQNQWGNINPVQSTKSTKMQSTTLLMQRQGVTATKCAVTSRLKGVTCVDKFALLVRILSW